MKYDRSSQVWQIASDEATAERPLGSIEWKTFTVISTTEKTYETISGAAREYVTHKVVVSETGAVVPLNEDISIPWEDSPEIYKRVA